MLNDYITAEAICLGNLRGIQLLSSPHFMNNSASLSRLMRALPYFAATISMKILMRLYTPICTPTWWFYFIILLAARQADKDHLGWLKVRCSLGGCVFQRAHTKNANRLNSEDKTKRGLVCIRTCLRKTKTIVKFGVIHLSQSILAHCPH